MLEAFRCSVHMNGLVVEFVHGLFLCSWADDLCLWFEFPGGLFSISGISYCELLLIVTQTREPVSLRLGLLNF